MKYTQPQTQPKPIRDRLTVDEKGSEEYSGFSEELVGDQGNDSFLTLCLFFAFFFSSSLSFFLSFFDHIFNYLDLISLLGSSPKQPQPARLQKQKLKSAEDSGYASDDEDSTQPLNTPMTSPIANSLHVHAQDSTSNAKNSPVVMMRAEREFPHFTSSSSPPSSSALSGQASTSPGDGYTVREI